MRNIRGCFGGPFLAILLASCRSSAPPTTPSTATATTAPTAAAMISGVVLAGTQPLQGVQVDHGYGPNSWVFTDANGVFQLPATAGIGAYQWVRASKQGYAQPCAASISGNAPVTVQMVPRATLTGTPLPSASGFRTISGVAVQLVNGVNQTMAGVWVDFEPGQFDDWPAAVTFSDANGQFSLCGLPADAVGIGAATGNLFGYMTVPPGTTTIEITLHN